MKYEPIVYALLEFPCAAIAWQTTSMMSKRILKQQVSSLFVAMPAVTAFMIGMSGLAVIFSVETNIPLESYD